MFIVSFIVASIGMFVFRKLLENPISISTAVILGIFTAFFATIAETISHKGTDNLMVPLGAGVILDFLYHSPQEMQIQLISWMIITTAIAIIAYK